MGERNSVYVFKGPSIDQFRDAITSVVAELGGRLKWDQHPDQFVAGMLTSHNDTVHAAYIHQKGHEVAEEIGVRLKIPWINIRIQEGSLWDYSLYDGKIHVDNFSTLPEYWEDDEEWQATQRGKPNVLANLWQVDQRTVENYLKPWGYKRLDDRIFDTILRGKAYPTDRFEYGDIWQMTDFLCALGAHDPNFDEPHSIPRHLKFPSRKKPWWRFW
jgi:hypothetical protein